jgi:hypothetical protein
MPDDVTTHTSDMTSDKKFTLAERSDLTLAAVLGSPLGQAAIWLGEETASGEELLSPLKPYAADRMRAFPIGAKVGNVKNEGPELLQPIAPRRRQVLYFLHFVGNLYTSMHPNALNRLKCLLSLMGHEICLT